MIGDDQEGEDIKKESRGKYEDKVRKTTGMEEEINETTPQREERSNRKRKRIQRGP